MLVWVFFAFSSNWILNFETLYLLKRLLPSRSTDLPIFLWSKNDRTPTISSVLEYVLIRCNNKPIVVYFLPASTCRGGARNKAHFFQNWVCFECGSSCMHAAINTNLGAISSRTEAPWYAKYATRLIVALGESAQSQISHSYTHTGSYSVDDWL